MMFAEFEGEIMAQAAQAYPLESVWLITEKGSRQVENISKEPGNYFSVSEKDTRRAYAEGLLAVVHSHCDGHPVPSAQDMSSQLDTAVPWGVLSTDGRTSTRVSWWGTGVPKPPLIGRTFKHGITDCYALVKDYFEMEKGIHIPEFPRDWEWWGTGGDLMWEGFAKAGFVLIDQKDAMPGDGWIAQIRSPVANHCGILLEDGLTLHQAGATSPVDDSKLSVREPVFRYSRFITHWLRYAGVAK